ncbi:hypothetical protein JOM56_005673, partial [Amanita muscaria]
VRLRNYKKAIDNLEGLVVSRIFELAKMNMPQTGYKLRKQISNALQARSAAVKAALKKYNAAASALTPPAPQLSWEEVVRYTFLSEFDLLRDARQDIREKLWANSTNRQLRDQFFKQERAREEIQRLNVEIKRVVSYMHDEVKFLKAQEELAEKQKWPELAHQISLYRGERGRFNSLHQRRFSEFSLIPQFSGDLSPATAVQSLHIPVATPLPQESEDEEEAAEGNDDEENLAADITLAILSASEDKVIHM